MMRPRVLSWPADSDWTGQRAAVFDVAHIHDGKAIDRVEELPEAVEALRAHGVPVVWTVHHLAHPELDRDDAPHLEALSASSSHVNRVTTFTDGAAEALSERLGRPVEVLPHGPLVDRSRRRTLRARRALPGLRGGRAPVLAVVGQGRRNADVVPLVEAATNGRRRGLRLLLHRDHRDAGAAVDLAGDNPEVEVVLHDGLDQSTLEHEVLRASALVLPHLWGTHSGLAELAADLGTPVIPASCGRVDEQVRVEQQIAVNGDGLSSADLAEVFNAASLPPGATEEERERAEAHATAGADHLYRNATQCSTLPLVANRPAVA